MARRNLRQQLLASLTRIAMYHLIPVLGRPHKVILAVLHRVAATLVFFRPSALVPILRVKARKSPIPYRGL